MKQIAKDFSAECQALADLVGTAPASETLAQTTQFKEWTIADIFVHLHLWNVAAGLSLKGDDSFAQFFADIAGKIMAGKSHQDIGRDWVNTQFGGDVQALYGEWLDYYPKLARAYTHLAPETRLQWAGPSMAASDSLIARQMETWAHGQAVFDILGVVRQDTDRIKNIAQLGVKTYSWTFKVRQMDVPQPKPYVQLRAPSGQEWTWNTPQADNYIKGAAHEFCQTVAQTRNIADTTLDVVGSAAQAWMANAQCFAGGPEQPPAKGLRFCVSTP